MDVRFVQLQKIRPSISVTLSGMVTDSSRSQRSNAPYPMETTPSGITISLRFSQNSIASSPMLVTLPGITTDEKRANSNASGPIVRTVSGMMTEILLLTICSTTEFICRDLRMKVLKRDIYQVDMGLFLILIFQEDNGL